MGAVDRLRADVADLARLLWELLCGGPLATILPSGRMPSLLGRARRGATCRGCRPRRGHRAGCRLRLRRRAGAGVANRRCRPEGCSRHCSRTPPRRHAASPPDASWRRRPGPTRTGLQGVRRGRCRDVLRLGMMSPRRCSTRRRAAVHGGRRPVRVGQELGAARRPRSAWRQVDGLRIVTMVLGDDPVAALARGALGGRRQAAASPRPDRSGQGGRRDGRLLVIVVDQFEECWTTAAPAARDDLIDALATVAGDLSVDVRIVVALRADLYDAPLRHPAVGTLLAAGTFAIPPMSPGQLGEAIVRPAERRRRHSRRCRRGGSRRRDGGQPGGFADAAVRAG